MTHSMTVKAFAFALAAFLVPASAAAEDGSRLFGTWQMIGKEKVVSPFDAKRFLDFSELVFARNVMYAADLRIPVRRYEIDGKLVRVHADMGETYSYELLRRDLLCLPKPRIQPLDQDDAELAEILRERTCYRRI